MLLHTTLQKCIFILLFYHIILYILTLIIFNDIGGQQINFFLRLSHVIIVVIIMPRTTNLTVFLYMQLYIYICIYFISLFHMYIDILLYLMEQVDSSSHFLKDTRASNNQQWSLQKEKVCRYKFTSIHICKYVYTFSTQPQSVEKTQVCTFIFLHTYMYEYIMCIYVQNISIIIYLFIICLKIMTAGICIHIDHNYVCNGIFLTWTMYRKMCIYFML